MTPLLGEVYQNAVNCPEKVAIIIDDICISYGMLISNVRRAASFLDNLGLSSGDKIILSARKEINFVYIYFGAQLLGITNVIIDAETNIERLKYLETRTSPNYCFGYLSPCGFNSILFESICLDTYPEFDICHSFSDGDSVAEIMFTTGTTGQPKGVCLSYSNIFSSASNINSFIKNTKDDIEVIGLPICHSFGLGRLRCNLIKGATVILLGNFGNIRKFLNTISKYHVTGFGLVPAAWAFIRKVSGLRIAHYSGQINYIEIGSASMPLETKKELLVLFPKTRICMHYGLTESSRSCFIEFHDVDHLSSIGKPVSPSVDVKIISKDGSLVDQNVNGEICVKGGMVMKGYLNESDNKNAFWGDYFRTGDLGYIDKDGYVYLVGREKEMINVGGKKVGPQEVEDAIISCGVGDCICIGIDDETGVLGEKIVAFVLKGSTEKSFEELSNQLRTKLELYKIPSLFEWIDEIPKSLSGKKMRVELKSKYINIH